MSKLIIIRGNSGCGKTTVAKALQHRLGHNTMLVSQDYIRREMLYVHDGPSTEAVPLLTEMIRYGWAHSEHVILEGILYSDFYKPLFVEAGKIFRADIFAFYYNISFEETLRRHNTKPNRADFGQEAMKRWWRENDFLEIIQETELTSSVSEEEAVSLIYKTVKG